MATQEVAVAGQDGWTITVPPTPGEWANTVGRHNADLTTSTARVLGSGTWKQQRTICLLPAGKSIDTRVYANHRTMITPPNQGFTVMACVGDEVGIAYSNMMQAILADPVLSTWEYVLTIEHDNTVPPDGLLRLMKRMDENPQFAAISGLYWTKGEGGVPQIWGDIRDPQVNYRPQAPVPGELVECYGLGMGFVLHRMSMFRELKAKGVPQPWWKTRASAAEGIGTQDLYAWGEIFRPHGYRCAVDCACLVGHLDVSTGICW